MRWPWQPAPGMVRVKAKDAAELYATALRIRDLEAQAAVCKAETAALVAASDARDVLDDLVSDVRERSLLAAVFLRDLPVTADGRLHVEAFTALVEQQLLAHLADQLPHRSVHEETR